MRLMIFALVGLVLGMGAGGGLGGLRAKNRILEVRADSVEQALADSALAASHVDADEAVDGHGEELPVLPAGLAEPTETDGPAGAEDAATPPAGAGPAAEASDETDAAALKRLGRIFMAMKPQDAAEVLNYLNDREVEAILFQVRDKEAAEILGHFPADRAAILSRSVLSRSGGVE